MKKTALYERHALLGGTIVDFGDWAMPVQYTKVIEEHNATRHRAGLFDICHMGEIEIKGRQAFDLLQLALSRNLQNQYPGQMKLGLLLNAQGGIMDDVTVYPLKEDAYLLVTNAATKDRDYQWLQKIKQEKGFDEVSIMDISDRTGKLDLQGPVSEAILQKVVPEPLNELKYYHALHTSVSSIPAMISRSGYTGEDGFEIYAAAEKIGNLWDDLLDVGGSYGLRPVGLGARDTLRLEAGLMLNGAEMDETVTPYEVVYGWITNMEKGFIGKAALEQLKREGFNRKLVGFTMTDRGIARHGYKVFMEGQKVGYVTSGTFSPTLGKAIGLAFVPPVCQEPGTVIEIEIRNNRAKARIVSLPFYKRKR